MVGDIVLQECIEIFKEEMERANKRGEDIILDEYKPAEGYYIIVKKDCTIKSCFIQYDKKTKNLEGINKTDSLYRDICFYDYHSRIINSNKGLDLPGKKIKSNNYMSFCVDIDNIKNGVINDDRIDNYYDSIINKEKNYKDNTKKDNDYYIYDYIHNIIGDIDMNKLNYNKEWIKKHINNIDELGLDLKSSGEIKIFFEDNREIYLKEEMRYLIPRIFNKNTYNFEMDGKIYGIPNDNISFDLDKKPYLAHKTRKIEGNSYIDIQQALLQRKFFDYLNNLYNKKKTIIYFDNINKKIYAIKDGIFIEDEKEDEQFYGYKLQIYKDRKKGLLIKEQDILVDYKNELDRDFNFYQAIATKEYSFYYGNYTKKSDVLKLLDEILFYNYFKENLYKKLEDIQIKNSTVKKNIIMSRDIILSWLMNDQKNSIANVINKICIDMIKDSIIKENNFKKNVLQFNLMASFKSYFGGEDMSNEYKNIHEKIDKKLSSKNVCYADSDEEYLYALGQLIRYYVSINKSGERKHSLSNPFFNISNNKMMQEKLFKCFKSYNYCIAEYNQRYNQLYSMVACYNYDKKIDNTLVIAGYISQNLIYKSDKDMKNKKEDK